MKSILLILFLLFLTGSFYAQDKITFLKLSDNVNESSGIYNPDPNQFCPDGRICSISINDTDIYKLEICNPDRTSIDGLSVERKFANGKYRVSVDMSALNGGYYYIKLSKSGFKQYYKFIVVK